MATDTATDGTVAPGTGIHWRIEAVGRNVYALWGAFLLVHVVLWLTALFGDGMPLGDVTIVYRPWAQEAQYGYAFMGVTAPWVYPVLAMVPVLIPLIAGPDNYVVAWLAMVTIFDVVAFAVLTARGRRRPTIAAWWWLGFLLLLGPIAVGRLDAVSVAIVIVAVVWIAARPSVAAVLLTVATWIKVWPAGVILAVVIALRRRWRVVAWGLATSAVIALLVTVFGGAAQLFSFVSQQASRGLQIEAPISAPWMWAAALHAPGSSIYYDQQLLTFQVTGWNIDIAIAAMTPALAIAVLVVALLGVRAVVRKAPTAIVLPQLMLAIITVLIAFNKVGSPQYVDWLAAPVILGIIMSGRRFLVPAVLVGVTAALTQLFYPYLYVQLLDLDAWMLAVVTARNIMLFVVLGWAVAALWRTGHTRSTMTLDDETAPVAGAHPWPLARDRAD
ncbi:MAG TPA: glycosyltransferase 87 family protein [Humibacter sp.]|nr:glycosyltransferase 87 family protein [Humibacter sp.]